MTREELHANKPGWYIMKFEFKGFICQEPALLNANHEVTVAGTSQVVDVRDIHKLLWKIENVEPRKYADPEPGIYRVRDRRPVESRRVFWRRESVGHRWECGILHNQRD